MKRRHSTVFMMMALVFALLVISPMNILASESANQEHGKCQHYGDTEKKSPEGHSCTISEAEMEMLKKAEQVTMTGKILCAMCDLKMEKKCQSLFKEDSSGNVYSLVDNKEFHEITSHTKHGEKAVVVTGRAASSGDKKILEIGSFEIKE